MADNHATSISLPTGTARPAGPGFLPAQAVPYVADSPTNVLSPGPGASHQSAPSASSSSSVSWGQATAPSFRARKWTSSTARDASTADTDATDEAEERSHNDLIDKLKLLHADELVHLAARRLPSRYGRLLVKDVGQCVNFVWVTWKGVFGAAIKGRLALFDLVAVGSIAFVSSVVMACLLPFCLFVNLPLVTWVIGLWGRMNHSDYSLVNAVGHMFRGLTLDQADAGKIALSQAPTAPTPGRTMFNLDVAKLLLQLSSLMYERGSTQTRQAVGSTLRHASRAASLVHPQHSQSSQDDSHRPVLDFEPGALLRSLVGTSSLEMISNVLHKNPADDAIAAFTRRFGIEYVPVSELDAEGSAYAAMFWNRESDWVVVAFKGTSPGEYDEWVWDFTYRFRDASAYIPGFKNVHEGFFDRLFVPSPPSHGHSSGPAPAPARAPYDTICASIRLVTAELLRLRPSSAKVNVYFTGHSLGCGIASLAYARTLARPQDLGERVCVRDAYLFGAPVVCDPPSVQAFDRVLSADGVARGMWRVVDGKDAVCTLLPDFGDDPVVSQRFPLDSPMNFAHLGSAFYMRAKPSTSLVSGLLVKDDGACVVSSLPPDLVGNGKTGDTLHWWERALAKAPGVGRMVDHVPVFYWDSLMRVGLGDTRVVPASF